MLKYTYSVILSGIAELAPAESRRAGAHMRVQATDLPKPPPLQCMLQRQKQRPTKIATIDKPAHNS